MEHKILKYIKNKINSHSKQKKPSSDAQDLVSLSSKKDIDINEDENMGNYIRYLDGGIANPNNHNIALTGKYGSGKSSIMDSYINDKKLSNFLRVSLASFSNDNHNKFKGKNNEVGSTENIPKGKINNVEPAGENLKIEPSEDNSNGETLESENKLEQSIINQILYQIDNKNIPLTNFKIKKPIKFFSKIYLTLEFFLIALLSFAHFHFLRILEIYNITFNIFSLKVTLISSMWLLLIVFLSFNLWSLLKHLQIKKLKISYKNVDASLIGSDYSNDLFEKYVDEIIYLFQSSKKNILIIEDIDRFENLKIFQQLRELNIKLNNSTKTPKTMFEKWAVFSVLGNTKQKKWTFIYLVKDDMFSGSEDRVKFFDLIIPVIPYVTVSNSTSILKNLFGSLLEGKEANKLLDILGTFITDYRLLKNIHNEYVVFSQNLNKKNYNQLLALVAYKNLYPKKFDDIQNGGGTLKIIKDNFRNHILNEINKLETQKAKAEEYFNQSVSENEKELILILFLRSGNSTVTSGYYGNQSISILQNVDNFISGTAFTLKFDGSEHKDLLYSDFIKTDYYKNSIHSSAGTVEHEQFLKKIQDKIVEFQNQSFSSLEKKFFLQNGIQDDLLFALIKNGFINEHYLDIINHSYGGSNNELFKNNLYTESETIKYDLELTSIDELIKLFASSDYEKPQILNFSLFRYALTNKLDEIKKFVATAQTKGTLFLERYLLAYPNDIYMIEKYTESLEFNLEILESYANSQYIVEQNMYENEMSNLNLAYKIISSNLVNKNDLTQWLNSDIYFDLKKIIIKNLDDTIDFENIANNQLIDCYMEYDKLNLSSKNINKYLSYLSPNGEPLDTLPENFINYVNRNIEHFSYIDDISKATFDLIIFNNTFSKESIKTIFVNYPRSFGLYDQQSFENIDKDFREVLLNLNLFEKNSAVFQLLENHSYDISDIFSVPDIIAIDQSDEIKLLTSKTMNYLSLSPSLESLSLFAKNLNNSHLSTRDGLEMISKFNSVDNDISKFVRILSAFSSGKNYKRRYIFKNVSYNVHMLTWLKESQVIKDMNIDSNNKISVQWT
ncbi:YobI family P-loop NTPase [Leuconostoc mesenteroides]|uniref:YobI family P-loop NTPase n=1 Tax=Leuconostoc mesenteroides TaxID=1245 RepID=UPI000E0915DD|nr:hypothetical protein [Leuconostoc mesenteroides]RDG12156.1 hypothetical protein DQM12_09960 [Leuconostoc mesenteroides subsp. mesenteroides]